MVEEDLDLFWHSTLSDLRVKIGICFIKRFAVHMTELFIAATWSATVSAVFYNSHSTIGKS